MMLEYGSMNILLDEYQNMQSDCAPLQSEQTLGKNLLKNLMGLQTQAIKLQVSADR